MLNRQRRNVFTHLIMAWRGFARCRMQPVYTTMHSYYLEALCVCMTWSTTGCCDVGRPHHHAMRSRIEFADRVDLFSHRLLAKCRVCALWYVRRCRLRDMHKVRACGLAVRWPSLVGRWVAWPFCGRLVGRPVACFALSFDYRIRSSVGSAEPPWPANERAASASTLVA